MPGMPSSSRLETPAEWPVESKGRFVLGCAGTALLGLLSVGVGLIAAGTDFEAAVKYTALFTIMLWSATAFGYLTRLRPQHRASDISTTTINGHRATAIRYSGAQFALINLVVACLLVFTACVSWDYAHAGGDAFAPGIPTFFAGLFALFFVSFFVLVALGRIRRGRIILAADGIHHEGRSFESFLPWDSVVGIKAGYNGTREVLVVGYSNASWRKRQLTGLWKLDKLPPVPMIEVDTVHLAVDPTLVYRLVRLYVENPHARGELGTETVVRRVQEQSF